MCPVVEQVCNAHVPHDAPEVVASGNGDLRDVQVHQAARGKQMGLDFPRAGPGQPDSRFPCDPSRPCLPARPALSGQGKEQNKKQDLPLPPSHRHLPLWAFLLSSLFELIPPDPVKLPDTEAKNT